MWRSWRDECGTGDRISEKGEQLRRNPGVMSSAPPGTDCRSGDLEAGAFSSGLKKLESRASSSLSATIQLRMSPGADVEFFAQAVRWSRIVTDVTTGAEITNEGCAGPGAASLTE